LLRLQSRSEVAERVREAAARLEPREHEPDPRVNLERGQAHVLLAEALDAFEFRRAEEPAVQAVAPAVVSAPERATPPRAARGGPGAGPADFRERAQRAAVADDEDFLAAHARGEVAPGRRDVGGVPDELPRRAEDARVLPLEDRRVRVDARRKRRGSLDPL